MKKSNMLFLGALVSCAGQETKVGIYNTPPSATFVSPVDNASFDEGDIITFSAKVNDDFDDPEELILQWSSDIEGELFGGGIPDSDGMVSLSTANFTPGTHVVSLLVVDSNGDSGTTSIVVNVIDLPDAPEIAVVHPINNEYGTESTPFSFVAEISDSLDENEDLDVTFSYEIEESVFETFCSPVVDGAGIASCDEILPVGDHLLQYVVTNTRGFSNSTTALYTVVSLAEIDNDGDGFTEVQGDCDDSDSSVYPGAPEVENGIDDDCNGDIDEGDDDGDGYNEAQGDCNDSDVTVYPDAPEVANGIDDDCDGQIDEGTAAFDDDGDCFCEVEPCVGSIETTCTTLSGNDCNDADVAINPGAQEVCSDGIDNNCNGTQEEENALGCTTYYYDYDGDGYGEIGNTYCGCTPGGPNQTYTATQDGDCYDLNTLANPGQTGFFSSDRGDGSFDYNCDSSQEKQYTSSGSCNSWGSNVGDCTFDTQGWTGGTPNCGVSSDWIEDNDSCSAGCEFLGVPFCCEETPGTKTQKCR